ncbi:MAG: V-type ATP synthase subunit E [Actinobacteria bacterium]|nr:V-type ATP synthase subunit E [Actinomycetota bacterium]
MKAEPKSAVEEILKGLEEEGEREKQKILKEARLEAKKILEQAKLRAKEAYEEIIKNESTRIQAETSKILRKASIEAEKRLAEVKSKFLSEVFEKAISKIENLKKTKRYEESFRRLLEECLSEVGISLKHFNLDEDSLAEYLIEITKGKISKEEAVEAAEKILKDRDKNSLLLEQILRHMKKTKPSIIVYCSQDDVKLAEKILSEMKINAKIKTDANIKGGVKVSTVNGRIIVDNSLNARMEKLKRLYTKELIEKYL